MDKSEAQDVPKILISSDGTYETTRMYVNGQEVPVKRIYFNCHTGDKYGSSSCSIEIEVVRDIVDGIEKVITMSLRQPFVSKEADL